MLHLGCVVLWVVHFCFLNYAMDGTRTNNVWYLQHAVIVTDPPPIVRASRTHHGAAPSTTGGAIRIDPVELAVRTAVLPVKAKQDPAVAVDQAQAFCERHGLRLEKVRPGLVYYYYLS